MNRYFLSHFILLFSLLIGGKNIALARTIKTIVIDAGHGGKDPGTLGAYSKEKTIALKVAKKVGHYFNVNFPDVKIIYTRDKDVFVELEERAAFANRHKADLFISIHLNSCGSHSAKGTEVYHFPQAATLSADIATLMVDSLAKKNKTGGKPDYNYSRRYHQLVKMSKMKTQDDYIQSVRLAKNIDLQLKTKGGRKSRGIRSGKLLVLGLTEMPAVLVEIGYLSNASEETYMNSEAGQVTLASAIYRGIKNYKLAVEGKKVSDIPTAVVAENTGTSTKTLPKVEQPKASPAKAAPAKPSTTKPVAAKTPTTPAKTPAAPAKTEALYRVKLGVFSKLIPTTDPKWKKVEKLKIETKDGKYHYFAIGYMTQKEAIEAMKMLRESGFSGAFVDKKD